MDLPSGAQVGVITRVAMFCAPAFADSGSAVSWRSWPPPVDMIQIWLEPPRLLWNASHFPSGDGAGSVSLDFGSARSGRNLVANPGDAQAKLRPRPKASRMRGVNRLRIVMDTPLNPWHCEWFPPLRPRGEPFADRKDLVGGDAQRVAPHLAP